MLVVACCNGANYLVDGWAELESYSALSDASLTGKVAFTQLINMPTLDGVAEILGLYGDSDDPVERFVNLVEHSDILCREPQGQRIKQAGAKRNMALNLLCAAAHVEGDTDFKLLVTNAHTNHDKLLGVTGVALETFTLIAQGFEQVDGEVLRYCRTPEYIAALAYAVGMCDTVTPGMIAELTSMLYSGRSHCHYDAYLRTLAGGDTADNLKRRSLLLALCLLSSVWHVTSSDVQRFASYKPFIFTNNMINGYSYCVPTDALSDLELRILCGLDHNSRLQDKTICSYYEHMLEYGAAI